MINQYDMGSCQAIGDADTAGTTMVEPPLDEQTAPRLCTVAETVAAERHERPGVIAVLAYQHLCADPD